MGTEWDKEVVGKVDPQKRVLCLAQVFLSLEVSQRLEALHTSALILKIMILSLIQMRKLRPKEIKRLT